MHMNRASACVCVSGGVLIYLPSRDTRVNETPQYIWIFARAVFLYLCFQLFGLRISMCKYVYALGCGSLVFQARG